MREVGEKDVAGGFILAAGVDEVVDVGEGLGLGGVEGVALPSNLQSALEMIHVEQTWMEVGRRFSVNRRVLTGGPWRLWVYLAAPMALISAYGI